MNFFNKFSAEVIFSIMSYLRKDLSTLHSLLLVNRLIFSFSVQFLYENVLCFNNHIKSKRQHNRNKFEASLFSIIINCLDIGTKKKLEVAFQKPIFKNLIVNYLNYCKKVSLCETCDLIRKINTSFPNEFLEEEVIKLFTKNPKLKKIIIGENIGYTINFKLFTDNLETISLMISDECIIDDSINLIHFQKRLYNLKLCVMKDLWNEIIPKLSKIYTLKKLCISGFIPDSFLFINNYPKLVKFKIEDDSAFNENNFYYLEELNLRTLRNLKIGYIISIDDIFTSKLKQFFKNNGNRLDSLHLFYREELMLTIVNCCKNIEHLSVEITIEITKRSLAIFKYILNEFKNLKHVNIICNDSTITPIFNELKSYNKNTKFINVITNKEPELVNSEQDIEEYERYEEDEYERNLDYEKIEY